MQRILLAYALLSFGLGGAQFAEANCDSSGVPTVDLRSETTSSLRLASTPEDNFILNRLGIMYARGRGVPKNARLMHGFARPWLWVCPKKTRRPRCSSSE
jgi:hypothetical protein